MRHSALDQKEIYRGESLGFTFLIDDDLMSGWTGEIDIKADKDGSSLITPRAITSTISGRFSGTLTPDETDLAPGFYFLIGKFTNTDREIQQALRFRINQAWV